MTAPNENTITASTGMVCDDCRTRPAAIKYPGDTITYYLCMPCAEVRVEALRKRMTYLTKEIRVLKAQVPATWLEFLRSRQTS